MTDRTLSRNTPSQLMLAEPERSRRTPAAETVRMLCLCSKEKPRLKMDAQL